MADSDALPLGPPEPDFAAHWEPSALITNPIPIRERRLFRVHLCRNLDLGMSKVVFGDR